MLSLTAVTKTFADIPVINSLTLHIVTGRTTVLIGPSGCGKSTILRLIVGLMKADAGSIAIRDNLLTPASIQHWRQRIGYVIQDGGLFPHLNARENICLMARYLRWNQERIQERTAELARLFKLPEAMLDRHHYELSGGQRQRLALMRAMMLDPELLLLDEPLGALDPMIRFDLQQEMRDIFTRLNKTVLMVTHDMGEAGFFGNQIVLLQDGTVVQQGSMADLLQRPASAFVEQFIRAQRQPWHELEARLQ
ncbi:MAG: ABC transporter ATP-binding protein [Gammaproteobacteria bacterium]|nr:ABC transporter ATP-binding protein [Gammaproteobacteria bacterium]